MVPVAQRRPGLNWVTRYKVGAIFGHECFERKRESKNGKYVEKQFNLGTNMQPQRYI
jgi:hypothetical protein